MISKINILLKLHFSRVLSQLLGKTNFVLVERNLKVKKVNMKVIWIPARNLSFESPINTLKKIVWMLWFSPILRRIKIFNFNCYTSVKQSSQFPRTCCMFFQLIIIITEITHEHHQILNLIRSHATKLCNLIIVYDIFHPNL